MRAVFLDRDGVLNRDGPGFVTSPDELHLLPGAAKSVAALNREGVPVVVATNQSCIGRGILTEVGLGEIHARLKREIGRVGGWIDAIYHCPHAPWEGCSCRKPKPGMLLRARDELGIDLAASYFVGDKPTDIECGARAGCTTVLVLSGLAPEYHPDEFEVKPDHVCADLPQAVDWILRDIENRKRLRARAATEELS